MTNCIGFSLSGTLTMRIASAMLSFTDPPTRQGMPSLLIMDKAGDKLNSWINNRAHRLKGRPLTVLSGIIFIVINLP